MLLVLQAQQVRMVLIAVLHRRVLVAKRDKVEAVVLQAARGKWEPQAQMDLQAQI